VKWPIPTVQPEHEPVMFRGLCGRHCKSCRLRFSVQNKQTRLTRGHATLCSQERLWPEPMFPSTPNPSVSFALAAHAGCKGPLLEPISTMAHRRLVHRQWAGQSSCKPLSSPQIALCSRSPMACHGSYTADKNQNTENHKKKPKLTPHITSSWPPCDITEAPTLP